MMAELKCATAYFFHKPKNRFKKILKQKPVTSARPFSGRLLLLAPPAV